MRASRTVLAATAKAADDFNGDGYRDMVLLGGAYGRDSRVTVVYGTSAGPGTRVQTIHQDSPGIPGSVEAGDQWGFAAAGADLDRDGYAGLVVASPGGTVGDVRMRGGLTVVWGGSEGLGPGTVLHPPVAPEYEGSGDRFGLDVVAGDFDGDGYADLAVGAPGEDLEGKLDGGSVTVLPGRAGGLTGTGSKTYPVTSPNLPRTTLGGPFAH
ncbi:FG-GAP and VCBS repeat-containing protein [Streptomyces sp. NPDC016626]|uniref:FG-GAP and VCBS repeat-containing protein n=1 Tax=Streptomyces sp. NPDC016626 TaxID=3364968 RepID=UPI003702934D